MPQQLADSDLDAPGCTGVVVQSCMCKICAKAGTGHATDFLKFNELVADN